MAMSPLSPRDAHADEGDGIGAGPVLAIKFHGGAALGWEVSGTYRAPFLKLSLGGEYPLEGTKDAKFHHYLAYEPWFLVGGTIGFAVNDSDKAQVMYGAWEGLPTDFDQVEKSPGPQWMGTITVGWRAFGAKEHSIYFTPKLWWYHGYYIDL
jgi:hypothetical protein